MENEQVNAEKLENYDFTELDLAVRRWAAQTGHDDDQEYYRKLKEQYQ
jgi:hypothetical protein